MTKKLIDSIELEYMVAMNRCKNNDEYLELEIGLKQYREMFKTDTKVMFDD